ncbi:MAG TPA: HAMP domain-containing protein, partial [Acidimicrobiales bacterium]|nr:HAMP domain-containing protein [Acidimicrobiales bacterium]
MNSRVGLAHFGGVVVALTSAALTNAHLRGVGVEPTDVVVLAVYLPATMIGCGLRGYRLYLGRTAWLNEGRSPSLLEQRSVLGLPLREAIEGFMPWIVAALIFGALNLLAYGNGLAYTLRTFLSIVLGGLTASAMAYLLAERTLRPVFALALVGHVPQRAGSLGVRAKLLLSGMLGCGVFLVTIGLSYVGRPAAQPPTATAIWFLAGSGLAAGFIVLYAAARSLADPLQQLHRAVHRMQLGDLDVHVDVDDAGELGLLQAG